MTKKEFEVFFKFLIKPIYKLIEKENCMSLTILPFDYKYQFEVIDLIEHIQVGKFNIPIEEVQQKKLHSIPQIFQKNNGNYWIALFSEKVIGTIAVIGYWSQCS